MAVHTTEYLVASNDETVEAGGTVFYRRRDIEALVDRLRRAGHAIDVDFTLGSTPEDLHVDVPPYTDVHLRTRLGDYETTSLALVITKGSGRRGRLRRCRRRRPPPHGDFYTLRYPAGASRAAARKARWRWEQTCRASR